MPATEAQIRANRANAALSTGPRTAEGKSISRRNGLKHGLAGDGVVVPQADLEAVERMADALEADMRPNSPAGLVLIRRMATLAVRMDVATRHEFAARARNVRHAADDFDEARIDEAETLLDELGESPRNNLRKLRKSPEGVDLLVAAWRDLRADLTRDPRPLWTAEQLVRAANLTGLREEHARGSALGALSKQFWGDFTTLGDSEGDEWAEVDPKAWAKDRLVEQIDAEIAALETHRETLDFETIELDRAEAGERALFETSKDATLARRYDSEAQGGFFKALKEFRQVESESAERAEADPTPPRVARSADRLGSSWDQPLAAPFERDMALVEAQMAEAPVVRGPNGEPDRPSRIIQNPN